ncbi:tetraacyldisaccharide 4'-kinase [Aidingimonas halophila]|uniref:Tetraacyldisaccharide 4'-kinase n=1 Tax=Aidingimonas halophila TaxID=574349 RepID=A0A1H2QQ44_9GAMM|nr:tetraacyldisaccharide 4'-kinase [Aidingimonas halophila]GHC20443.1 tetraacyldisaccharide 4'-kinase [Aidingimonas halophila]SDW09000.1 lipid-A-disaccharide kinase [Aidingimonas halophila]
MSLSARLLDAWYNDAPWLKALRPLAWAYQAVITHRSRAYAAGKKRVWKAPVPVIVVGNITLGGTGKSPLVAWLAQWLAEQGWRPGIVSRGYGSAGKTYPLLVTRDTPVSGCGDEPAMLAAQLDTPLVADPDRPRGARRLLDEGCDILLADDGLQHLALGRDIELVVVDGKRGFGNGACLPAGPLREPLSRLERVDAVIVNGQAQLAMVPEPFHMTLEPLQWRRLADDRIQPLTPAPFSSPVHAVAGIGHPQRFFATLEALNVPHYAHAFPDHHTFHASDLAFGDRAPVVMTAKDAVKCRDIVGPDCWVLDVVAAPEAAFVHWLSQRLDALHDTTDGAPMEGGSVSVQTRCDNG